MRAQLRELLLDFLFGILAAVGCITAALVLITIAATLLIAAIPTAFATMLDGRPT